jgi:type I restriction-modification system DNA methylase subunit
MLFNAPDVKERREKQYLSISGKYDKNELEVFSKMLAITTMALEENPSQDFLGRVFMLADFGNDGLGQFFTPYNVSLMMARISLGGSMVLSEQVEKNGFITICEPCVGAGGILIAAFNAAKEDGVINPQTQILFYGTDLSPQAVYMAYIQCSLLGMSAIITVGNSLTFEHSDTFFTPLYCLNRWRFKKREGETEDIKPIKPDVSPSESANKEEPASTIVIGKQYLLFDDAVAEIEEAEAKECSTE